MISRRLAGLLINFKESDWSHVPKFKRHMCNIFLFSKGPRALIKEPDAFWASPKLNVSYHGVDSVQM